MSISRKLDKKLRKFFLYKTSSPLDEDAVTHTGEHRYVPKAYSSRGPGWGVFDKKQNRYIDDEKEIMKIPLESLMFEKLQPLTSEGKHE